MDELSDERRASIGRLKWQCRRAMLELDLVFQRFWEREGGNIDESTEAVLTRLLELEDHDLWALVSNKTTTGDVELAKLIKRLQMV